MKYSDQALRLIHDLYLSPSLETQLRQACESYATGNNDSVVYSDAVYAILSQSVRSHFSVACS